MWKRFKVEGEVNNRGWDGWLASLTWWPWIWASSKRWWRTGKPDVVQSMGSQRVGHNWVTEMSWSAFIVQITHNIFQYYILFKFILLCFCLSLHISWLWWLLLGNYVWWLLHKRHLLLLTNLSFSGHSSFSNSIFQYLIKYHSCTLTFKQFRS